MHGSGILILGDNTYSLSLHLSLRMKKGMASKQRAESPLTSITDYTLSSDNTRGNLILVDGLTYLVKWTPDWPKTLDIR